MRAKSLKSSQILRAHMPYFRRPGHIYTLYYNTWSKERQSLIKLYKITHAKIVHYTKVF